MGVHHKSITCGLICCMVLLWIDTLSAQQTNRNELLNLSEIHNNRWNESSVRLLPNPGKDISDTIHSYLIFPFSEESKLPTVYEPANRSAAEATGLPIIRENGSALLSLSGAGRDGAIWDVDSPRISHQEFDSRITYSDSEPTSSFSSHATHVSGTILAAGIDPEAEGMATQLTLKAFNWENDLSEMAFEAADGLPLSAHPYNPIAGWQYDFRGDGKWVWYSNPDIDSQVAYQFGFYDEQAHNWDEVAYNAPNYLIVKAAGNTRGRGPETQPVEHWTFQEVDGEFEYVLSNDVRPVDGGVTGFMTISGASLSKNVLTVGALNQNVENTLIEDSGFGPTGDGRIKPEIVASGNSIYSSSGSSDSSYEIQTGTSSSVGVVSGTIALLQEHYHDLNNAEISAATLKALIIQTADSFNSEGRPDYRHGWGAINGERAARFLSGSSVTNNRHLLQVDQLMNGQSKQYQVEAVEGEPIRATIAWTDPPGPEISDPSNREEMTLINDLDIILESPSGEYHQPWVLDPAQPTQSAIRGDNNLDNHEQIWVDNAEEGIYTIHISHKGSLFDNSQSYALLAGPAEPYIFAESIATGSWLNSSTWNSGNIPAGSFYRVKLHHIVNLEDDRAIWGMESGVSGQLDLNSHELALSGGLFGESETVFGSQESKLLLKGWLSSASTLSMVEGGRSLSELIVNTNFDQPINLDSDISIHDLFEFRSGELDLDGYRLSLQSSSSSAATYFQEDGSLLGDLTYERFYGNTGAGWRMISSPFTEVNYSSLQESFHTQGGEWAQFVIPEPGEGDNQFSNLWFFDMQNQEFSGYYGSDNSFTPGYGAIFYQYEESIDNEALLPGLWRTEGTEPGALSIELDGSDTSGGFYHLAGNPYAGVIDWGELYRSSESISHTYAVWDPSSGSNGAYIYYNHLDGVGTAGPTIAPAQGFMVEGVDTGAKLNFDPDQKIADEVLMIGKQRELTYIWPPMSSGNSYPWQEKISSRFASFDTFSMALYYKQFSITGWQFI